MKKKGKLWIIVSFVLLFNLLFTQTQFVLANENDLNLVEYDSVMLLSFDSENGTATTKRITNQELNEYDLSELKFSEYKSSNIENTVIPSMIPYELNSKDEVTFEYITEDQIGNYDFSNLTCSETKSEICEPEVQTFATYTEKVLRGMLICRVNGDIAATVTTECTVWYYTDNKVHLYRRTITKAVLPIYDSSYITYGDIVNTDGAFSYTSGDKFTFKNYVSEDTTFLNFYVTPTNYEFSH